MMDTSALLAALVADHEHHALARPHLVRARALPAITLAETYSQLRRTFGQTAATAAGVLRHWWSDPSMVLATTGTALLSALSRASELDLGGNIHDALIAEVCKEHGVAFVTLDVRQHRLALAMGAASTYLLA